LIWVSGYGASYFLRNIETFFSYQSQMKRGTHKPATSTLREGLSLRDVSFTYPSQTQPTLNTISLDLKPGRVRARPHSSSSYAGCMTRRRARSRWTA